MPKLILDVMGGDIGPAPNLDGALRALTDLEGELILLGDETAIRSLLKKRHFKKLADAIANGKSERGCKITILHSDASAQIEMDDSIKALRKKPGASINMGCKIAAEDWKLYHKDPKSHEPSAFVSAGHSGAVMAAALLNMGRLKGAERPAIAVTLPTITANGCVVLDVGANVDCKPEHLRDFALMGSIYAQVEQRHEGLPRVGVLSNGEEKSKGNELTRASCSLIETTYGFRAGEGKVGDFIGYVEGKEIFKGNVDVVVTDGFVGNIVLKTAEGLGSAVVTMMKREVKHNFINILGFLIAGGAVRGLKKKLDYAEYGAAPLLGVAGYAFICHGRSNAKAIKNALLRTQSALRSRYVEKLEKTLIRLSEESKNAG